MVEQSTVKETTSEPGFEF